MIVEPLGLTPLLVQLGLILVVAYGSGQLFQRFGQSKVIGEIVGGMLLVNALRWLPSELRPTLFGGGSAAGSLKALGQIGLIVFMFSEGCTFDTGQLKSGGKLFLRVAAGGFFVPLLLGSITAALLDAQFHILAGQAPYVQSLLFIGVILSVTAFPVLITMLKEQPALSPEFKRTVIASAALTDLAVWISLSAITMMGARGGPSVAGRLAVFALYLGALVVVSPWLSAFLKASPPKLYVLVLLVGLLFSAALTEQLRLHAAIGAFCFGLLVPKDQRLRELIQTLEGFCGLILFPVFFTLSGVQANFQGVGRWQWFIITGLIVAVAFLGKIGGCYLSSRQAGFGHHERLKLGILMNARGLVEIVALQIGRDLNIISSELYTALLVMALLSTVLAVPLLKLVDSRRGRDQPHLKEVMVVSTANHSVGN